MASDHARIRRDIWTDDDWRGLTSPEQWLYFHLLSSPTLTFCGTTDWRPARIAAAAADMTADYVRQIAASLTSKTFILTDEETEEVVIRSWAKHDGLLKSPNMCKAYVKDHGKVASSTLRAVIVGQLHILKDKYPAEASWETVQPVFEKRSMSFSEGVAELSATPTGNPSPNPTGNPEDFVPHSFPPFLPTSLPPSSDQTARPRPAAVASEEFEKFWSTYPRKQGKAEARKAYVKASKKFGHDLILDGITGQLPWFEAQIKQDGDFRPTASKWLNGERWNDEQSQQPGRKSPSSDPATSIWERKWVDPHAGRESA